MEKALTIKIKAIDGAPVEKMPPFKRVCESGDELLLAITYFTKKVVEMGHDYQSLQIDIITI